MSQEMSHRQWVIYELVKAEGGSQTAFANLIGTTPQNVNNWLKGVSNPSMPVIEKISEIYGLSIDGLIKNEDRFIAELRGLEQGMILPSYSDKELAYFEDNDQRVSDSSRLSDALNKLNDIGKSKVADYAEDLSGNTRYTS